MRIDISQPLTVAALRELIANEGDKVLIEFFSSPSKNQAKPCWCGCGGTTQARFAPGHDARFHGLAKRVARGERQMPETFVNNLARADFMKWHDQEVSKAKQPDMPRKETAASVIERSAKIGVSPEKVLPKPDFLDRAKGTDIQQSLFDEYLFADYSGGGEDHRAQGNISLYSATRSSKPYKLKFPDPRTDNFSRDSLTSYILSRLDEASANGKRVVFGFDHQYGWPPRLREHAGILDLSWRDAVARLGTGHEESGLPPLDIPKRYCKLFNDYSGKQSFWTTFEGISNSYEISRERPTDERECRFRLTELVSPIQGNSRPASADAVGGIGEGIVGGQTICGIRQIGKMLHRSDIAWWPFDGLNIQSNSYRNKHVAIEIYPSAVREGPQRSDDHDASETCRAVRDADANGSLRELMNLQVSQDNESRILKEGWIIGMDPSELQ